MACWHDLNPRWYIVVVIVPLVTVAECDQWQSACPPSGVSVKCGTITCQPPAQICCNYGVTTVTPVVPACTSDASDCWLNTGALPGFTQCERASDCQRGQVCCSKGNPGGLTVFCAEPSTCQPGSSDGITFFSQVCQLDCDCEVGHCDGGVCQ